jgi:hypothetical protein
MKIKREKSVQSVIVCYCELERDFFCERWFFGCAVQAEKHLLMSFTYKSAIVPKTLDSLEITTKVSGRNCLILCISMKHYRRNVGWLIKLLLFTFWIILNAVDQGFSTFKYLRTPKIKIYFLCVPQNPKFHLNVHVLDTFWILNTNFELPAYPLWTACVPQVENRCCR